jgi:uncharacterized protein (TIGR02186 family)
VRLALLALAVTLAGPAMARDRAQNPILVPAVSQPRIEVRQGFTGTQLLLYGAILSPEGARAAKDYDIVIVLEGPARPLSLREKKRVAGVWVNADSTTLRSVPGFYAVVSNRPLAQIVDERTAAIYQLGLTALQLSPSGSIDPAAQEHFAAGLVDLMRRSGLYLQDESAVRVKEQVLYEARIALPSHVPVGTYTAETFAVQRGRVLASATARVEVEKQGFEKAVADFSRHQPVFYGLLAVGISIAMGWLAGRVLALI